MLSEKKITQLKQLVTLRTTGAEGMRAGGAVRGKRLVKGNFRKGRSRKEKVSAFDTPGVMLCSPPQGRTTESPAPLQTSPHPGWSQDEGLRAHDAVPGVLGRSQALCTPAPQRQHDHGEWQDQHHSMSSPVPMHLSTERRLVA